MTTIFFDLYESISLPIIMDADTVIKAYMAKVPARRLSDHPFISNK